ncbi:FeoA family protein [Desulforhopalus sp. IMCC35007]|uniref:FeoA family protein n=1 Tax=Desulforhopalus sp. IMCC35007 TaxID=2569543 RepID=UPI0010AE92BF|nr:FeoA family protein [Desulforhopalus sp. IMCC35007]TKB05811.1 ferrous iron transport protein A [Desulforhopalus sp. IMCC35007]
MKKLEDLQVGESGRVVGFTKGSSGYRQKLLAMGLIKGTDFKITRVAPMGDPVEIVVRNYKLSLRKQEAGALIVEEIV